MSLSGMCRPKKSMAIEAMGRSSSTRRHLRAAMAELWIRSCRSRPQSENLLSAEPTFLRRLSSAILPPHRNHFDFDAVPLVERAHLDDRPRRQFGSEDPVERLIHDGTMACHVRHVHAREEHLAQGRAVHGEDPPEVLQDQPDALAIALNRLAPLRIDPAQP